MYGYHCAARVKFIVHSGFGQLEEPMVGARF
jgi:hypothetical protein